MSEKSQYKTKQREQLLSYLAENPRTHFTAADICEHFRLGGQKIGGKAGAARYAAEVRGATAFVRPSTVSQLR